MERSENFKRQNEMARDLLTNYRGQVLATLKATRAGATTSLLKEACKLGQRTVIIAPYIEIFEKTVKSVENLIEGNKPKIGRIPKNEEICEKVKERIKKYEGLESLPFHFLPSCKKCQLNDPSYCKLQEILNRDFDIVAMTYSKLKALCESESETSSALLEKIKRADNLILDEFTFGLITSTKSAEIEKPYDLLNKEFDFSETIAKRPSAELTFWEKIFEFARLLQDRSDNLKEEWGIWSLLSKEGRTFFEDEFVKCWEIVGKLIIDGKDTKLLQQLLQIATSERFWIAKKHGKSRVTPIEDLTDSLSVGSRYLKDFLTNYLSNEKLVTLVDAYLPDLDLSRIFGVPVKTFNWGDPDCTNKSQLVICDTRKFGVTDFLRDERLQRRVKKLVKLASETHGSKATLIVALNTDMAEKISSWQKKKEIPNFLTTYYRSDLLRGITPDPNCRFLVLLSGPYLPNDAYLPETYTASSEARSKLFEAYRDSDMKSTFINTIGRVKDPHGEERSVVYAMGIDEPKVRKWVTQRGLPSPWVARFPVHGADPEDFLRVSKLFLDEPMERWIDPEKDITMLATIVKMCQKLGSIQAWRIVQKKTAETKRVIDAYQDILEKFHINITRGGRGTLLELEQ